ncbi:MAG: hypothetical protein KC636_20240, partial [Myxococcales bacterium]|nr:hypothetical protein [Myxococcales bacterium]
QRSSAQLSAPHDQSDGTGVTEGRRQRSSAPHDQSDRTGSGAARRRSLQASAPLERHGTRSRERAQVFS